MVERVTVAVDGGPASQTALAWVIDRANTVPLRLEITSVVGLEFDFPAGADNDFRGPHERAVDDAQNTVKAQLPDLVVSTKIRHGIAHEALVLASQHADILVIGTNKTSPIAGIMHGTLSLKVAGQSECITVVVPVDWKPSQGSVVAGWADDPTADAAVDFAADEAERRGTDLTVVHTWSMPPVAPIDGTGAAVLVDRLVAADRQLFSEATDRLRLAHPTLTVTPVAKAGSAAVAIVRTAKDAALVVVGSHGRGAVAGFFLGSVSHDVLLNMPAPVAVVPRKHEPIDVYPELVDEDS